MAKSIGRWYDSSLKDTKRGSEALEQASVDLQAVDKCGLPETYKVWCLQLMLIPKLLWPLLVYEISTSTAESIEAKMNRFTRKWLGIPPCLINVAMYYCKAMLRRPLKSIVEEYKCGKVRLMTMHENSEVPAVRSLQPHLRTFRKRKGGLKMKKVIGLTQTGRKGLGSEGIKWWSKAEGKDK
ncbi:reverse transcriptase [Plakobranchus ocellatus]|uniref:Reverse transcriptase n=1 Tax=Plakobranchus ocellatus TaxID=259542 RepID=A0AAV3ZRJ2_9GAST|nr:reverse transcriptase [Plakobranchus ocellatus]